MTSIICSPRHIAARDGLRSGALFDDSWVSSSRRVSNGTGPTQDRADVWGTNLSIGWDVSDGLSIKSITGYREMDAAIKVDMDQSPFPIVHTDEVQSENQFSQELQFSGASADKKLHWLVGAYYFRERAHDRNQTLLASGLYDALGLLPAAIVPLIPGLTCPSANPLAPCAGGAGNPVNALLDLDVRPVTALTTNNWAIFGQASYEVADGLSFTLGGRYSWEKKRYFIDSSIPYSGRVATPPTNDQRTWRTSRPSSASIIRRTATSSFTLPIRRASRAAAGTPVRSTPGGIQILRSQKLEAYELGLKTRMLDGRMTLNVAGFHSKYKDLQLQTNSISPTTGGLILTVDNAGAVDIWGAEAELLARPVDGLLINGALGYLHNEYKRLAPGTGDGLDAKLPRRPPGPPASAPRYAGSALGRRFTDGTRRSQLSFEDLS